MTMYLTLKIPQEDRQIRLIIITSFLAVLQLKKTLTKFKSVTIQLILNMRLSAVLSDLVIGHQGLSSDCLQCSPAVHFQPWWHHTTSSLHTNVSHTFVQLDCL